MVERAVGSKSLDCLIDINILLFIFCDSHKSVKSFVCFTSLQLSMYSDRLFFVYLTTFICNFSVETVLVAVWYILSHNSRLPVSRMTHS